MMQIYKKKQIRTTYLALNKVNKFMLSHTKRKVSINKQ